MSGDLGTQWTPRWEPSTSHRTGHFYRFFRLSIRTFAVPTKLISISNMTMQTQTCPSTTLAVSCMEWKANWKLSRPLPC